jgi:hypothetical protein
MLYILLFCEDAPDRRSTDIQLPGDFGFADALTEELAHIGGLARRCGWAAQPLSLGVGEQPGRKPV